MGMCDNPRPAAKEVVAELRRLGIEDAVLLTSDPWPAARAAAGAAGISRIIADLKPEEKAERIVQLAQEHYHVAMVGDGAADAQALAMATLGISIGTSGSDLARESADVVVMGSDLRKIPFLVSHARRTLSVIRQNIAFALAMKVLFLASALAGMATLWMAVAADMGATFAVILNGLRLLRALPHQNK
jgi:Cd2+/Zn2+-exporting ATPase